MILLFITSYFRSTATVVDLTPSLFTVGEVREVGSGPTFRQGLDPPCRILFLLYYRTDVVDKAIQTSEFKQFHFEDVNLYGVFMSLYFEETC